MRLTTLLSLIGWIITGGIAGYLASVLLGAGRNGCLLNIILGIVGALVGGFVIGNFLAPGGITGLGFIDAIINATVGAVIVLILIELMLPGRQLGDRDRRR